MLYMPLKALTHIKRQGSPPLSRPERLSADMQAFLRMTLDMDHDKRPSAEDLLKHPFMNSADPASTLGSIIVETLVQQFTARESRDDVEPLSDMSIPRHIPRQFKTMRVEAAS